MCIFNAVKKQSGIGLIANALFGNFAYLHSLYTVVEVVGTNFVLKNIFLIEFVINKKFTSNILIKWSKHFVKMQQNYRKKYKKKYDQAQVNV